ncbi:MAG: hypothetical protein ACRDQA_14535 [Nocardioidaceae bacterium]
MSWHIVSQGWRVDSPHNRDLHRFTGPTGSFTYRPPSGYTGYEVQVQYPWAVMLDQDDGEKRRDRITVMDLRTHKTRRLRGDRDTPPPTILGSFVLSDGRIAYASGNPDGRHKFCLAQVRLKDLSGRDVTCAKRRRGFDDLSINGGQLGADSFKASRGPKPSCRSLVYTDPDGRVRRLRAAAKCKGWGVVPFAEGSVFWTQVMKNVESYHGDAYARTAEGDIRSLGLVYSGFSVPCGQHVYFVRDNDSDTRSDELMRWSPDDGLEKVWTPDVKGHGDIMIPPSCGGTNITIGALGGDYGKDRSLVTARIAPPVESES